MNMPAKKPLRTDGHWKNYLEWLEKHGRTTTRGPAHGPDMQVESNEWDEARQKSMRESLRKQAEEEERIAAELEKRYPRGSYWFATVGRYGAKTEVTVAYRDHDGDWLTLGDDQTYDLAAQIADLDNAEAIIPIQRIDVPPAVKGAMAQQLLTEADE